MALTPVDVFISGNGRLFYETSSIPELEIADPADPRSHSAEPEDRRLDPEETYPSKAEFNTNGFRQLSLFP